MKKATELPAMTIADRFRLNQGGLFTTQEVANLLRCTPEYIAMLANRGDLIGAKVGRHWKISKLSVDAYLAAAWQVRDAGEIPSTYRGSQRVEITRELCDAHALKLAA